ncbi:MAG TPA: thioredoxin domain-containing protein [Solirubrobacterales bacterium]|nr:thioredoxin domain-containing protein [Solirubrobacterales bacterium]
MSSEVAVKPLPRRGRLWVIAVLALGLFALGYTIVETSTQEADDSVVRLDGIEDAQRLFGGIPQEGDRLGSDDAPVAIQVFNDIQCDDCRDDFLATVPQLTERYVRPGDVKLLWRHYSNSVNPEQLGFYGAEAAAEQNYGWQYIYLFFRNQDEAERVGIDDEYLATVAGGAQELDIEEWEADLEENGQKGGPIEQRLESDEELGRELEIRTGQGMVLTGPNGTVTLQEGPSLAEVEAAIAEVAA